MYYSHKVCVIVQETKNIEKEKVEIEVIYFSIKIYCKTNHSPIARSQSQSTIKASLAGLLKELWFHFFKKSQVSSLKLPRS